MCESGETRGEVPSSMVCECEEMALPTSTSLGNERWGKDKGEEVPFSMVGEGKEMRGEVPSSLVC